MKSLLKTGLNIENDLLMISEYELFFVNLIL